MRSPVTRLQAFLAGAGGIVTRPDKPFQHFPIFGTEPCRFTRSSTPSTDETAVGDGEVHRPRFDHAPVHGAPVQRGGESQHADDRPQSTQRCSGKMFGANIRESIQQDGKQRENLGMGLFRGEPQDQLGKCRRDLKALTRAVLP